MRKITEKTSEAFKAGKYHNGGNTTTDGQSVLLFGNPIARKVNGELQISMAGWVTRTTCERINGILTTFGSEVRVGITDYSPVFRFGGKEYPIPNNQWITIKDIK